MRTSFTTVAIMLSVLACSAPASAVTCLVFENGKPVFRDYPNQETCPGYSRPPIKSGVDRPDGIELPDSAKLPDPAPPPALLTATAKNDVDIHAGPDGQFEIIGMLGEGKAGVVNNKQNGWYQLKVNVPGGLGWVAEDHLTVK